MLIKNNKAFTLIELMVVISLLAIILVFALPNISSTLERNKKDQMINDAKDMVEKAKNYILMGNQCLENKCFLNNIDSKKEIKTSPFGKDYDRNNSYVLISSSIEIDSGIKTYTYSVYLTDGTMCIEEKENSTDISNFNKKNKYDLVVECK